MKRGYLFWLGMFVVGGFLIFVIGIFLLGQKEKIFEETFVLHTYFDDVAGLRSGAPVRLSGIDIGVVESIHLPAQPGGRVEVVLKLDKDVQKLIKKDALAVIQTEGLVGDKILAITGGSLQAPSVADADTIQSRSPIALGAILESFDETAQYMRAVTRSLDGITAQIHSGRGTIGKLVYDDSFYNRMLDMTEKGDSVFVAMFRETIRLGQVVQHVAASTDSIIRRIQSGQGTLGALIYRDDLHNITVDAIAAARDSLNALFRKISAGEGLLGRAISDTTWPTAMDSVIWTLTRLSDELVDISKLTRLGMLSFAENMEALKHNWLFRGYFERRGFWSRTEFEEYYEKRKAELREYEKRLKAQEKELRRQARQLQEMRRRIDEQMKQLQEQEKQQG
ncbi:MAG: MlaD family protein [candidate division KSB1 bacterium]|nr:MlaD family protein [candidate division KSB1 bacterium]